MSRPVLKQTPEERRERSRESKRAYNARERDAFHAFRDTHGQASVRSQKEFRALMRKEGWALPTHGSTRPIPTERLDRTRAFVERGLGRDFGSDEFDRRYNRNR